MSERPYSRWWSWMSFNLISLKWDLPDAQQGQEARGGITSTRKPGLCLRNGVPPKIWGCQPLLSWKSLSLAIKRQSVSLLPLIHTWGVCLHDNSHPWCEIKGTSVNKISCKWNVMDCNSSVWVLWGRGAALIINSIVVINCNLESDSWKNVV